MVQIKLNLRKFNKDLNRYQKKSHTNIEKLIMKVAVKADAMIKKLTPVYGLTGNQSKPRKGTTKGRARASWRLIRIGKMAWKLVNPTPYIRVLEYGGYLGKGDRTQKGKSPYTKSFVSKQAPKGMVRITFSRLTKMLKRGNI